MSSNLVIAAIPDENDRVWKVSSEKIPHLTVLFLGETDAVQNLEQIMLFVEHAANTSLKRFYLPVDRRGELGSDNADVLFFKKGRYDYKAIREFRSMLLQDPNIKTAYDSAEQFEGPWNPHLTLGYPETPAKSIPDEQTTFFDVSFNKIAVWTGDFEGPDWLLKDYWDEMDALECAPMDVAMSAIGGEDSVKQTADLGSEFVLEHHGVKGQKWGVRKVEGGGENAHIRINQKTGQATTSEATLAALLVPALVMPVLTPLAFLSPRVRAEVKATRAVNKGVRADKKWQKQLTTSKRAVEVHNTASDEINKKIPAFNNDKRWKGVDLNKDAAKKKEYDTAVERELLNPAYANAAVKVHGTSPTGRYKFEIKDSSTGLLKLTDTAKVEHAAGDEMSVQFKILRDENGHILGFTSEENDTEMAQTVDLGLEFLSHYGKKGMKWGVRSSVGSTAKSGANRGGTVGEAARASAKAHKTVGKAAAKPVSDAAKASAKAHVSVGKAVGRGAKKTGKGLVTLAKDVGFETESSKTATQRAVVSTANKNFNKQDLPRINAKYKETKAGSLKGRLKSPLHPDTLAYRSEARIAYRDRINETVANLPTNASKTRKYEIEDNGKTNAQYGWTLKAVDVKKTVAHADPINTDTSLGDFDVRPVFDSDGFIVDVKLVEDTLAQTIDVDHEFAQLAELGAEFLTHHGVKGMKWGQRNAQFQSNRHARRVSAEKAIREKRPAQEVKALDTIGTSKRKQSSISTKGGEDHPPTPEAISVAVQKQKIKKSGLSALSNNELQEVQRRLNLENDVKRLMVGDRTAGQKFIDGLLGRGSKEDRKMLENRAGQKAQEAVIKKVGKAAVGFV